MSDTTPTTASQEQAGDSQEQPVNNATPLDVAQTAAETAQAQAENTEQAGDKQDTTPDPQSIDSLPDWAQRQIRELRKESGNYRTKAKETADAKEAEKNDLIQQIGKALGLVEDTTADPEKLIETAKSERDQMAEQLAGYKRTDAIRQSAPEGTDLTLLNALLQSDNAFKQLDINSDEYAAQVAHHVTQAVETHPSLQAPAAPKRSGIDTSNTQTGADRKITREDLKTMEASEINAAFKAGKLSHLTA